MSKSQATTQQQGGTGNQASGPRTPPARKAKAPQHPMTAKACRTCPM